MNTHSCLNPYSLIFPFLLMTLFIKAQEQDSSLVYYDKGTEAFKLKKYKSADSLFSLSIKLLPHADTYFSRAACRQKMGNRKGFCQDLGKVIALGDKEAASAFCKHCGSVDSSYYTENGNPATKKEHFYFALKYSSTLTDTICLFYNKFGTFHPGMNLYSLKEEAKKNDFGYNSTINSIVDENAEFPGGTGKLLQFLSANIKIPDLVLQEGISVKVYLKFIVDENGLATNPEIIRSMPNCPDCEKEAIRIVNIMPTWKPAKMSGKPVKCYFNLPISFKSQ